MTDDKNTISYVSRVIRVGDVPLGGSYPIRIQSMTNTDTLDTRTSVEQCIRIIEAGADFVRLTAQGVREAENLAAIKANIRKAGFETPLIADIHFNPVAAETAARIVEKVRINPGNYADKRAMFENREFTEKEYKEELERIHEKLLPLIKICHENRTAIRLGINHGSLSDRIMTRYGNTPEGMVASAMEFVSIFRSENFKNLVLSMKSSDTSIMMQSTRMLVQKLTTEGVQYPLHLGVTEAGEGEDGRIRSAAGIGALLAEGIGDTIRVSLSEDPEKEIPVARKLADYYPRGTIEKAAVRSLVFKTPPSKPRALKKINGPLVVSDMTGLLYPGIYQKAGFVVKNKVIKTDASSDIIIVHEPPDIIPVDVLVALPYKMWLANREKEQLVPVFTTDAFNENVHKSSKLNVILAEPEFSTDSIKSADPDTTLLIFTFDPEKERYAADYFLNELAGEAVNLNVILNPVFHESTIEDLQVKAAALLGRFVTDKRISGISITNRGSLDQEYTTAISFSILQCTETRITRTMYLSCPTCGRTKFNLQESVKKVKEATSHLKGLKIAVMGCIVNGPGEMAGADYGYVGAAEGKVHIYKGTVPVLKNIPEDKAVEELLKFINSDIR